MNIKDSKNFTLNKNRIFIRDSFESSNKKNLIITGSKGVGKTTLIKTIVEDIKHIGIITYAIWGRNKTPDYIIMEDICSGDKETIARAGVNQMIPIKHVFDTFGVNILKEILSSEVKYVVIDEIGYLELISPNYCELLKTLFDNKSIIASVRREQNKLIDDIISRDDVFVIDINDYISTLQL